MEHGKIENKTKKSITILVEAGLVDTALLTKVYELVKKYNLGIYLSTAQNIRLLDLKDENEEAIKGELKAFGAQLKSPGKFPLPRVCVGSEYCNLGLIDTAQLSRKIMTAFNDKKGVKPKFKIAIAGCPASCSNALNTDIGIKATRSGYEIYVGGKGGTMPTVGRRIAKGVDESKVIDLIKQLVELHDRKTSKKMRMHKLLSDVDFPFAEV